jgi:RNA polymerase subunit RPABC4/transcription elongation factor Spt4
MAEAKLTYRCDKTRLTHEWVGPLLKADEVESNGEGENEYPCPMCGGRHVLTVGA